MEMWECVMLMLMRECEIREIEKQNKNIKKHKQHTKEKLKKHITNTKNAKK
jgi:hypothetical protein